MRDKANILFEKAETSAHLAARICPERVVLFKEAIVPRERNFSRYFYLEGIGINF